MGVVDSHDVIVLLSGSSPEPPPYKGAGVRIIRVYLFLTCNTWHGNYVSWVRLGGERHPPNHRLEFSLHHKDLTPWPQLRSGGEGSTTFLSVQPKVKLLWSWDVKKRVMLFSQVFWVLTALAETIWAAVREYHGLGGPEITEMYLSQFSRLGSSRSRCLRDSYLVKSQFFIYRWPPSYPDHTWWKERGSSLGYFIRALIPLMRWSLNTFQRRPKAPPPATITLELRFQHIPYGGHNHSVNSSTLCRSMDLIYCVFLG